MFPKKQLVDRLATFVLMSPVQTYATRAAAPRPKWNIVSTLKLQTMKDRRACKDIADADSNAEIEIRNIFTGWLRPCGCFLP